MGGIEREKLMVRSLFYKPKRREEDALTHRFLAIYERLSDDGRYLLFKNCKVDFIHELGKPSVIKQQKKLGDRIPDGLLVFADTVVIFENKLDTVHKSAEVIDLSQLKYYIDHLEPKYPKDRYKHRILIAADGRYQSRQEIIDILKEQCIPEEHADIETIQDTVDIILWQDLHHSCVLWELSQTSNDDSESLQTTELDRFLIEELRILLEEMKMVSYKGIDLEDLKGFVRSKEQLCVLEDYLAKEIKTNFAMLRRYEQQEYKFGSLYKDHLGFGFDTKKKIREKDIRIKAWLSVKITDSFLEIYVIIKNKELTSKFQGDDLEKFVSFAKLLKGFVSLIGPEKDEADLSKRLLEYQSRKDQSDFFEGLVKLRKEVRFDEVQKELRLNNPMLPQNLMKEIMELSSIITLMYQVLTEE